MRRAKLRLPFTMRALELFLLTSFTAGKTSFPSLNDILQNPAIRFVFVGGKGGVGKTTTSSGLAIELARNQRRVLLVSTDPAHSLGDAFNRANFESSSSSGDSDGKIGGSLVLSKASSGFSGEPTDLTKEIFDDLELKKSQKGSLHVMEVDPSYMLKRELEGWSEILEMAKSEGSSDSESDLQNGMKEFQNWLTSVPGVDEAVALASAVEQVQSGEYDTIVFDTAPTGHTVKLLGLPDILKVGLEQLDSWQGTLWTVWQTVKSVAGGEGMPGGSVKDKIAAKFRSLKASIEKVAAMMRDQKLTRFVAVCIAEALSVNETRRLLQELARFRVRASHVVVNQLISPEAGQTTASSEGLKERLAKKLDGSLLKETVGMLDLMENRRMIQQKYLASLKSFPEVRSCCRVAEMPLLGMEVTGASNLRKFGAMLGGKRSSQLPNSDDEKQARLGKEVSELDEVEKAIKSAKSASKSENLSTSTKSDSEIQNEAQDMLKSFGAGGLSDLVKNLDPKLVEAGMNMMKGNEKQKAKKVTEGKNRGGADFMNAVGGEGGLGDLLKNLDPETIKKGMDAFGMNKPGGKAAGLEHMMESMMGGGSMKGKKEGKSKKSGKKKSAQKKAAKADTGIDEL